jgi:transcriptional regulator with XRE-family HTH domain
MRKFTPNQVVANNLRRARELHRWTAEQAAEKLEPYLGERWSKVTWSAAERSVRGDRIRQFTADDLVAFAKTFQLPISFFLQPPSDVESFAAPGAQEVLSADELIEVAAGPEVAQDQARFLLKMFGHDLGVEPEREEPS